jgi:Spy/CpxP family protein refolding chaperone
MDRKTQKTMAALVVTSAACLGLFGYEALAQRGPEGHHARMRAMVDAKIQAALDLAKATPQQRVAIEAARDHVLAAMQDARKDQAGTFEEALRLFVADQLDQTAVAAHRARHTTEAKRVGDAVVQAFYDVHDALTAQQRQVVAAYVRGLLPSGDHGGHGGMQARFFHHLINSRIDAALDEVNATPDQRAKIEATRDRVIAALKDTRSDHGASLERILQLFTADKIDSAQLDALRAEHVAKMDKVADAMVRALSEVHDTLNATQRKQLVDWVRAHHGHWHG